MSSFKATSGFQLCLHREDHCCHLTPLCPYMARMHIWQTIFLWVSPPADLNENQLMWKACYLKMTSSFPINLSLSRCLFLSSTVLWLFTLQVIHQKRHKGRVTLVNFHHCECVHLYLHTLQSWVDKLIWVARQIQQGETSWRKTQVLCYAFQPFTFMSNCNARTFTTSDDVIKGRSAIFSQYTVHEKCPLSTWITSL